ncbi:uncharacterized protein LOC119117121 isoform X5 [Syngnathus acus]|uniref:uncharacterized protein LOC119117121 isoform X5 n=1 Tax=Syngnathus acus TaxID=161584 RepID=UPI001885D489|nr:uncharacterized protein LOC119117121 isoform X5 [Syngnathus acus]
MIGQVTRWACLCVLTRGRTVSSEVSSSRWARRKQESCTRASERASERASLEQRTAVDASGGGLPQNPEAAGRVLKHIRCVQMPRGWGPETRQIGNEQSVMGISFSKSTATGGFSGCKLGWRRSPWQQRLAPSHRAPASNVNKAFEPGSKHLRRKGQSQSKEGRASRRGNTLVAKRHAESGREREETRSISAGRQAAPSSFCREGAELCK